MSTTLLNCQILLSKEIGDYWESTTTSASNTTTIVDTALLAKPNDWITDVSYSMLTSGSYNEQERKISTSSSVSTGSLTTLAFGGSVASGVTYQVHRLFEPSEKRRALISAAKNIYPDCYDEIIDESHVSGNWLKDGSFEVAASSTSLTYWSASVLSLRQGTGSGQYKTGTASLLLAGTIGTAWQGITQNEDLKFLAGKNVTWAVQAYCNASSCLRLAISDGTSTTYSDYHDGGTAWTENNNRMYVQANIDYNPTEVTFKICHATAAGTSYVDDGRVISGDRGKIYIGNLGFPQNQPTKVEIEPSYYSQQEPWDTIHDWEVDENGYLYLPTSIHNDYRLRITGRAYLDFLSGGTSSTSWSSTINLNSPQTEILVSEAVSYLYAWMSMPNYETGMREEYQKMLGYWQDQSKRRKSKFGMPLIPITNSWGHE